MDEETLVPDAGQSNLTSHSFMEGLAEFRDIPFYTNKCKYPWEENEEEIKANEYHGIDYDKVLSKPWSSMLHISSKRRGGGGSNPAQKGRWRDMAATSAMSVRGKVDSPQPFFTNDEVLRVRLDMYHLKESCVSEGSLFNSETDETELCAKFTRTMTYYYHAIRDGLKAKSYPHFFHQFIGKYSSPCCKYIQPTTLEGDLQYIKFFDKLMESARYRETRDGVLAKAIVIANKAFKKMLFFQIEIAVDECLQLTQHLERMRQRHELYYYIMHKVLIEKKQSEAVIEQIREGKVQLLYVLTEFASLDLEECQYTVQDAVDHLMELTGSESPPEKSINDGTYRKTICNEVDKLFPRDIELYTYFLRKKMETAEEHNVIPERTCELRLEGLFTFELRNKEASHKCNHAYPTVEETQRNNVQKSVRFRALKRKKRRSEGFPLSFPPERKEKR